MRIIFIYEGRIIRSPLARNLLTDFQSRNDKIAPG